MAAKVPLVMTSTGKYQRLQAGDFIPVEHGGTGAATAAAAANTLIAPAIAAVASKATPNSSDKVAILDSEDSNALKQVTLADLLAGIEGASNPQRLTVVNASGGAIGKFLAVDNDIGTTNGVTLATSGTARVLGLALTASNDTETFEITTFGPVEGSTAEWDAVTGETGGLVVGAQYMLLENGTFTSTPVSASDVEPRVVVGYALTATKLFVWPNEKFGVYALLEMMSGFSGKSDLVGADQLLILDSEDDLLPRSTTVASIASHAVGPELVLNNSTGFEVIKLTPVVISNTGSNELELAANNDTFRDAQVVGILKQSIESGESGAVVRFGVVEATTAEWDAVTGNTGGLDPGSFYWLDDVEGMLTETPPTANVGSYATLVGIAIESTKMYVCPQRTFSAHDFYDLIVNSGSKATPVSADLVPILDSEADGAVKYIQLSQIAAMAGGGGGGGGGISWQFSTTTTDADPGPGYLRFNNATIASVTKIFFDLVEGKGATDVTNFLESIGVGASTVRGRLILTATDGEVIVFKVTGAFTTATGYRKINVVYVSGVLPGNNDWLSVTYIPSAEGVAPPLLFKFSNSNTDSDPGQGIFRFDNSLEDAISWLYINTSALYQQNSSLAAVITDWTSGVGSDRGTLVFTKSDGSPISFQITGAVTTATGYHKVPVIWVYNSGFLPANNEIVSVQYVRALPYLAGPFYQFATSTTDGDPGAGKMRFNNTTIANVDYIYMDLVDYATGMTLTSFIESWGVGPFGLVGKLIFTKRSGALVIFQVLDLVETASGYRKIRVSFVAGTLPSANEVVSVRFERSSTPLALPAWKFSLSMTDANPGAGFFRFNNDYYASISFIYLNLSDGVIGSSITEFIDYWGTGSGSSRGKLVITKHRGASLVFTITGDVVSASGYRKIPVTFFSGSPEVPTVDEFCSFQYIPPAGGTADVGALIAASSALGTPATGDLLGLADVSASNALKQIPWSTVLDETTDGMRYKFSTTTTDADPTSGVFRFNHATPASITQMYIDILENAGAVDVSAWIMSMAAGSGSNRGLIIISKRNGQPLIFEVTGDDVDGTGYYKLPVTHVAGTLPGNDEIVSITFQRVHSTGGGGGVIDAGAINVSDTPPADPEQGTVWQDSTTNRIYTYYALEETWVEATNGLVSLDFDLDGGSPAGDFSYIFDCGGVE